MDFALQAPISKNRESHSQDTDVWLTPPHILRPLGEFDLDPCSPIERPWPTAKTHFTKLDNGLMQPWHGRVWLNPPYGNELFKWVKRLAAHGNGTAFIFARTETAAFFEYVWSAAHAVMFLRGRVRFYFANGQPAPTNAPAPSVLIAYGESDAEILRTCGIDGKYVTV
jgi:hypothetical protein